MAPSATAQMPAQTIRSALLSFDVAKLSDREVVVLAAQIHQSLVAEAKALLDSPVTAPIGRSILAQETLTDAIAANLARRLCDDPEAEQSFFRIGSAILARPAERRALVADVAKAWRADPAVSSMLQPIFFFKGFQAIATHRIAHSLWLEPSASAGAAMALWLQSRVSEAFGVDIHPGATIGRGVMLDHATGIVIGGTASIGDDVYVLHGVTLGATGRPTAGKKRHPSIGNGVNVGAGATLLGDILVGNGAVVGGAAIVTKEVPAGRTVVGVNRVTQAQSRL